MQVIDITVRSGTPLVSAFRWNCCREKNCDVEMCDLHKLFHRMCGSYEKLKPGRI